MPVACNVLCVCVGGRDGGRGGGGRGREIGGIDQISLSYLQCELDHDNEVSCVDIDPTVTTVASGTVDGEWWWWQESHVTFTMIM